MSDPTPAIPESIPVPTAALANLAVEFWRLSTWLATSPANSSNAPARRALRKLEDFLNQFEIEIQSLDGRPYDPGLAARVVDTIEDPTLSPGQSLIAETLSPMIIFRNQVIRPAEVVTRTPP